MKTTLYFPIYLISRPDATSDEAVADATRMATAVQAPVTLNIRGEYFTVQPDGSNSPGPAADFMRWENR